MKKPKYPPSHPRFIDAPIPMAGSRDWLGLALLLKDMAKPCEMRANDLLRSPELRAAAAATASAYHFAALMIETTYYPR